jgi:hypothetical protein
MGRREYIAYEKTNMHALYFKIERVTLQNAFGCFYQLHLLSSHKLVLGVSASSINRERKELGLGQQSGDRSMFACAF